MDLAALLRRGVAYKGKKNYTNAKNDLQKVLDEEPHNKRAEVRVLCTVVDTT